jgi:hypothetical protein
MDKDITQMNGIANFAVSGISMNEQCPSSLENGESNYLVDWDGPDDPADPMNWPSARKWTTIALVSFSTFNVYVIHSPQHFASSITKQIL